MSGPFNVDHIDSWIEEETSEFKPQLSLDISYPHPFFDPKKTVLLHIQMEFCCQSLNEVIKQLSNELLENDSKITVFLLLCLLLIIH
jgi:hypothetical protein